MELPVTPDALIDPPDNEAPVKVGNVLPLIAPIKVALVMPDTLLIIFSEPAVLAPAVYMVLVLFPWDRNTASLRYRLFWAAVLLRLLMVIPPVAY